MMARFAIITVLLFAVVSGCSDKSTESGETPPIRITSPSDGATLSDPVWIRAAAGTGPTFDRVDFYIDGDSVSSDGSEPYQYYWNIYEYSTGTNHTIQANGFTADSVFESSIINVTISYVTGFTYLSSYQPNLQGAAGVITYGNAMFVAVRTAGVEIIDITDKYNPDYISRYDSDGSAVHLDLAYPDLYVADGTGGAIRVDFSDPDSLIYRATYIAGSANDVALSENYLFVAENDRLTIVDISDPDILDPISWVDFTDDLPRYVVARHDTAFVAANDKFYIVAASNPYSPDIVGFFDYSGLGKAVAVSGTLAFAAIGSEGIQVIDISDPSNPDGLGRYVTGYNTVAVDISDGVLFVGAENRGVYALDYSLPDTLILLDQFITDNAVSEVYFDWPYLYMAAGSNVDILKYIR